MHLDYTALFFVVNNQILLFVRNAENNPENENLSFSKLSTL